jgi:hypothetical protein
MEYTIIVARNIKDLIKKVNEKIAEGFTILEGFYVLNDDTFGYECYQPMMKYTYTVGYSVPYSVTYYGTLSTNPDTSGIP